jgi:hypothetical protein
VSLSLSLSIFILGAGLLKVTRSSIVALSPSGLRTLKNGCEPSTVFNATHIPFSQLLLQQE